MTPDVSASTAPPQRVLAPRWLGSVPYAEGLTIQADLVRQRRASEVPDQLLLLEHPHVITLGSSATDDHVLVDAARRESLNLELYDSGRGGDVTYHGPGQLVGYPILDLKPDRKDLHRYLRDLEEVLLSVVRRLGIQHAERRDGLTGVWVPAGKVAAIGVRVSSGWISSHGFALNVDPNLNYFSTIVPCGISDERVTSLARIMGAHAPCMDEVRALVIEEFCVVFGCVVDDGASPASGSPG